MSRIPFEVTSTLSDQLTERGIEQWWTGWNRLLKASPSQVWDQDPDAVIGAAEQFGVNSDYYV